MRVFEFRVFVFVLAGMCSCVRVCPSCVHVPVSCDPPSGLGTQARDSGRGTRRLACWRVGVLAGFKVRTDGGTRDRERGISVSTTERVATRVTT